jgi:excinuclease ABC subunit A
MDRPPVDSISGLAPAIAIDQKTASRNPRSTVATTTEIHDYLRLLYARVGHPHCWSCGRELRAWSPSAAAADLVERWAGRKLMLTAPLWSAAHEHRTALSKPAELDDLVPELRKDGFLRVLVDGVERRLDQPPGPTAARSIELVIDRTTAEPARRARLADALATAQQRGLGLARAIDAAGEAREYEARAACARCGLSLPGELTPRMFSFNSHAGACETCQGLGQLRVAIEGRLVDRPDRPLLAGAMGSRVGRFLARPDGRAAAVLQRLAEAQEVDLRRPWRELPSRFRAAALRGTGVRGPVAVTYRSHAEGRSRRVETQVEWEGLLAVVEGWWRGAGHEGWWQEALDDLLEEGECPSCKGGRLQPAALAVTVGDRGIRDVSRLTVAAAREFFAGLRLPGMEATIARDVLREIGNRLSFLEQVGLEYLGSTARPRRCRAARPSASASRASSATASSACSTCSTSPRSACTRATRRGCSPRSPSCATWGTRSWSSSTTAPRSRPPTTSSTSGRAPGTRGGRIVAAGTPKQVARTPDSPTGRYLSGAKRIEVPAQRRAASGALVLRGCSRHNLAGVDVSIPLGVFTAVTGVSGSGKSTLVGELLVPAVESKLAGRDEKPEGLGGLSGASPVHRLLVIDQSPLGRSPTSNAATYSGAFDEIRTLFASTPEARVRGFGPGRFSVNVPGGRCEACQGRGVEIVEMHFLSDVELPCEECGGRRFNRPTLSVTWKGKTIADVLDLEVGRRSSCSSRSRASTAGWPCSARSAWGT